MFYRKLALAFSALALFSSPAMSAEITMHGSTTVTANLMDQHKAAIEKTSGQTLKVISNGSSNGIKGATSGKAQIGMISAPLEAVVAKVNKKAPGTVAAGVLKAHQVGEARVAFTAHKSNTVKSLTRAQVTDILSGKITKWSDVGGADKPIIIITEKSGGGLRSMVEGELLKKASISGKTKEVPNATQVPKVVAQVPLAFGVMSAALLNDKINHVKLDQPIVQPLIFVTKGQPSADVQSVIDAAKKASGYK